MDEQNGFGLVNEPPGANTASVSVFLGAGASLPEQYIVPAYRSWFDDQYNVILANVSIKNQGSKPSCVGQSTGYQKGAAEGVPMSARDIYRRAKRLDGSGDPTSYGTSLSAGQDAVILGTAEERLVPEIASMGLAEYVSVDDVTNEVSINRSERRGESTYFVPRTLLQQTLLETELPVVTSTMWYEADNRIDGSGMMGLPQGDAIAGHAIACIGWVKRQGQTCLVFINSWGQWWGHHGLFFLPLAYINRLGNGYVGVDMKPKLAELLKKYNGLNVKVKDDPRVYKIVGGEKRQYENEIVFWCFGNLFGHDVFDISKIDLALIPKGAPMNIEEAPYETRELVRQIRQHYNLK